MSANGRRPAEGKSGVRSSVFYFDANWPGGVVGLGSVPDPVEDNIYEGYIAEVPGNTGDLAK